MSETTTTSAAEAAQEKIERKVTEVRETVSDFVSDEWDRGERELVKLRKQLKKHPEWLGAAAAFTIGGTVLWLGTSAWRRRNRRRPMAKVEALRDVVLRIVEHPEAVLRSRSPFARKLVLAVGSTVASMLVQEAAKRLDLGPIESSARA